MSGVGLAVRDFLIGSEFHYDPANPNQAKENAVTFFRAVLGEVLVTFLFILCVVATGANLARAGVTDPAAQGLATALVGVGLIYSFADVSGAHFNPAVTFGVLCRRKMSVLKCLMFIGAQLIGASCSILLIRSIPVFANMDFMVTPGKDDDKKPVGILPVFIMEFIMTFNLVYVIFATAFQSTGGNKPRVVKMGDRSLVGQNLTIYTAAPDTKAGFAPIAIGFTLGFLSFVGSTVSGGAYNPARVFAGNINHMNFGGGSWVYYVAEFFGGGCGALVQSFFSNSRVFKTKEEQDDQKQQNQAAQDDLMEKGGAADIPLRSDMTL